MSQTRMETEEKVLTLLDLSRHSRHGRDAAIVVLLAALTSATLGLVLSFRFRF